jgi:hypothetical protein
VLDDAMTQGLGTNYVFTMALKGLKARRNWKAASTLIGPCVSVCVCVCVCLCERECVCVHAHELG